MCNACHPREPVATLEYCDKMTTYEQEQAKAIREWKDKEPSVVSQTTGWVLKPLNWAVEKIIPASVIKGALTAANSAAEWLTDTQDILRDGGVEKIEDLRDKDLKLSDKLANEVHNWANATAAIEGAATGATGLAGMAVDVPALITMSLRVIHKIGLCYGYECKSESDKQLVYGIMSAAGANNTKEKVLALANIQAVKVMITKTAWRKMAEKAAANKVSREAVILTIKNLAKQLGVNLTRRKALQAIPVVGGVVGATMNVAFINDISWAARRTFQEMWLEGNNIIDID